MKTYDELTNDILEKTKTEKARRSRTVRRLTSAALALVLVMGGVLTAHFVSRAPTLPTITRSGGEIKTIDSGDGHIISTKADYSSIFELLNDRKIDNRIGLILDDADFATPEAVDDVVEKAADSGENRTADEAETYGTEYSKTNVQVEGIDEADVIKTDGKYIYAMSLRNVYVYSAENGEMELVSKLPFASDDGTVVTKGDEADKDLYVDSSWWSSTAEMYVASDRLIVICPAWERTRYSNNPVDRLWEHYYYSYKQYLCAAIYDISDKGAPVLMTTAALSGSSVSTRMIGDRLFLVCSDNYYNIQKNVPSTFIPKAIINGKYALASEDTIYCGEEKSDCVYLNVLELDAASAAVTSSLSLLGYDGETMYQSENAIYVAMTDYWSETENADGTGEDAGLRIEHYRYSRNTRLTKISLDGELTLAASTTLDGYLHNSFSMDEYDGYLRIVTSIDSVDEYNKWKDHEDELEWFGGDSKRVNTNSLYVLDGALNVVGSISDLAPDERVYSCRFEGDQGYFVTYRETDPLFHVDISDPTAPYVVDALKIPGHSDYLQRFGDLLFGFGQTDDGHLKLSMFSEDENGAMKEVSTVAIPDVYYSDALYDHHAIIADADKNIIAFAAEGGVDYGDRYEYSVNYYVLSYGEDGFTVRATIDTGLDWQESMRGLYIGDFFYVYLNGTQKSAITSYSLADFSQIDSETMDEYVEIDYGDYEPYVIFD